MEYLVYTKTCTRYIIRPLMEPEKHRNGWVIGLIVGSLVAFVLPLLIIIPISGLQTTSKERSSLTSTKTTIPQMTTSKLQTTSKELSTLASSTETTIPNLTTTGSCNMVNILDTWTWTLFDKASGYLPKPSSFPFVVPIIGNVLEIDIFLPNFESREISSIWLNLTNVARVDLFKDQTNLVSTSNAATGVMTNYLSSPMTSAMTIIALYKASGDITISEFAVNACT